MIQNWTLPTERTDADRIRDFRAKHKLTQEQFGVLVDRSRSTIAAYESGTQEADGAVTGLVRVLSDKPTSEIISLMARNLVPATLPIQTEIKSLERFLLEEGQTTAAPARPDDPESEWRVTRGVATKRFNLATIERLGQATMPGTDGGYLTSESTRQAIGPLAINSRLSRLGCTYAGIDGNISDFSTPILSDAGAYWIREGEAMPEVSVSLATANGEYKTVGTNLALSRRLLRMAGPSGLRAFAASMSRSLAREVDRAVLMGNGLEEPLGIVNAPGLVQEDATDLDTAFFKAVATLEANGVNSENISVICHPNTKQKLNQEFSPDVERPWIQSIVARSSRPYQQYRGFMALSLPSYTEGKMLIGDFSQVVVRVQNEIELRVLDGQRADGAHLIYGFLDCAIENPYASSAFVELTNVYAGS